MQHCQGVEPGRNIVEDNSRAFRKCFQLSHGGWLDDIEASEKYKTGEKSFPCEGDGNQRDQLPGDFVDYGELWIFHAGAPCDLGGCGNAD